MATRSLALRPSSLGSKLKSAAHKHKAENSCHDNALSDPQAKLEGFRTQCHSFFEPQCSPLNTFLERTSVLPLSQITHVKKGIACRAHKVVSAVAMNVEGVDAAGKVDGKQEEIQTRTLIKVCGVTSAEDAAIAAEAGADLIGMIMWPGSKRYVTVEQAAQISAAAKAHGAEPVAVFVDETASDISEACAAADISIAQLHGDVARAALGELPPQLKVVYVLHAESDGTIRTPLPRRLDTSAETTGGSGPSIRAPVPIESAVDLLEPRSGNESITGESSAAYDAASRGGLPSDEESGTIGRSPEASEGANAKSPESRLDVSAATTVEWLLVDGVSAGSGETYDWTNLRLPQGLSERGWLLAGGLDPTNVAAALGAASPDGVDVASGVAGLDKIRKDRAKVEAFIQAVKTATKVTAEAAMAGAL